MPLTDATVEIDRDLWVSLQAPAPSTSSAPAPWVWHRDVTLDEGPDGHRVTATWRVHSEGHTQLSERLVGIGLTVEQARVDGAPAPLTWGPDGGWVHVPVVGDHTLTVVGWLPAGAALDLLPAPRGTLRVDGLEPSAGGTAIPRHAGAWWTGAGHITLAPTRPRVTAGHVAVAQADLGLTLTDSELQVRGRVVWEARRGALGVVRLRAADVGDDAQLTAPPGATVRRDGDEWTISLPGAPSVRVEIGLTSSVRLPASDAASVRLPTLVPLDTTRTERVLLVARDSDLELVPELKGGTPIAADRTTAGGLVTGSTLAARTGEVQGSLNALRYVPADRPPVLVDVADITATFTPEGRMLATSTWTLRNEAAAAVFVHLPPGQRPLACRVDGQPVPVAIEADGDGTRVRIDLPRSPETVQGPLAFPVELTVLGDRLPAWSRRRPAALPLPAMDAPVAVRRVTVNLPAGWALAPDADAVDAFSEGQGLAYGFGTGVEAARQEVLYREALQAWMDNDFDGAQTALDQVRSLGEENDNVRRLQSNIDYVTGASEVDTAEARRVRDLAASRAQGERDLQADLLRKAKDAEKSGDVAEAEEAYTEVLRLADKLDALEQVADERQDIVKEEARKRLEVAKAAPRAAVPDAVPAPPPPPPPAMPAAGLPARDVGGDDAGRPPSTLQGLTEPEVVDAPPAEPAPDDEAYVLDGRATQASVAIARGPAAPSHRRYPGETRAPAPAEEAVTAVSAALIIPVPGEVARFQDLLVPAAASAPLTIPLRPLRRSSR